MVKGQPDNSDMKDVIVFHEQAYFKRDFNKFISDRWKEDPKKKDLYLIIQYLELQVGVQPSIGG
jgi:hypothetical protein